MSNSALPDWARAWGGILPAAELRAVPEDFRVDELLSFSADGDGEHDLLHVEKTGVNTEWLARALARHAGIAARDVGYAGMKDRNAVTTQYFTVRRPGSAVTDWQALDLEGVRVLDSTRHRRKLRRGAHSGNRFRIVLRAEGLGAQETFLRERWQRIVADGVPNYFGEQRFGHDGGNVELARQVLAGRRCGRSQRSIALSAARSFLFNRILAARVEAGSWNRLIDGDLANLDGSGSVFGVSEVDAELAARCAAQDLHPAGSLWGRGAPRASGAAADGERAAIAAEQELADGLERAGVDAGTRALRLCVSDATLQIAPDSVVLGFQLPSGAFATSVLREIVSAL